MVQALRAQGLDDVLVVVPYNAQVHLLAQHLPEGARIGTVDKFQGQEAPVCLISMATSSADELPRNAKEYGAMLAAMLVRAPNLPSRRSSRLDRA